MNRLGQLMIGLQAHAQTLQDAQHRQEITQTRLHGAMEAGLNASLAQISVIQKSAISLQTALHDASQSISQITSLVMIASKVWTWGPVAAIVAALMLAVFRYDARFASIIAAVIGTQLASVLLSMALINDACRSCCFRQMRGSASARPRVRAFYSSSIFSSGAPSPVWLCRRSADINWRLLPSNVETLGDSVNQLCIIRAQDTSHVESLAGPKNESTCLSHPTSLHNQVQHLWHLLGISVSIIKGILAFIFTSYDLTTFYILQHHIWR